MLYYLLSLVIKGIIKKLTDRREKMSHKSIIFVLAGLFCLGVGTSILFLSNVIFYPEFIFALFFLFMIIACIVFFRCTDKMSTDSKKAKLIKVEDSNVFLFGSNEKSHKSLFLKVSIITLAGFFKKR